MCFVDLEKAYDRVPRGSLWGVLREYGVPGPLVHAILSLYEQSAAHLTRSQMCHLTPGQRTEAAELQQRFADVFSPR